VKVLATTSEQTKIVEVTAAEYLQLTLAETDKAHIVIHRVHNLLKQYEKAQLDALEQATSKEQIWDVHHKYQLVIDVLRQCLNP